MGVAPEAGITEFRNPVASAREAGELVLVELRKSTMTVIPRTRKNKETKGAAAGRPPQDATGHLGAKLPRISTWRCRAESSPAGRNQLSDFHLQSDAEDVRKVRQERRMALF